jgi:predicted lipoprotein with Yx(FWY)xxD motif
MSRIGALLWSVVAVAGLSAPAPAQTVDVYSITTSLGDDIMTDDRRRTLYTHDLDYYDKPSCLNECAAQWPPFEAARDAFPGGAFTIIERPDGKLQWSYSGSPLYYSVRDKQAYDVRGDGIGGVWHYARLPGGND